MDLQEAIKALNVFDQEEVDLKKEQVFNLETFYLKVNKKFYICKRNNSSRNCKELCTKQKEIKCMSAVMESRETYFYPCFKSYDCEELNSTEGVRILLEEQPVYQLSLVNGYIKGEEALYG